MLVAPDVPVVMYPELVVAKVCTLLTAPGTCVWLVSGCVREHVCVPLVMPTPLIVLAAVDAAVLMDDTPVMAPVRQDRNKRMKN